MRMIGTNANRSGQFETSTVHRRAGCVDCSPRVGAALRVVSRSALPLDTTQRLEIFVTGAQAVFAIGVLASRSMSVREAQAMLGDFIVQFILQGVLEGSAEERSRLIVGIGYLVVAAILSFRERTSMRAILRDGFRTPFSEMNAEETSISAG